MLLLSLFCLVSFLNETSHFLSSLTLHSPPILPLTAIHWGSFDLGTGEHFLEPALELARARDVLNVPFDRFFTMAHGETVEVGRANRVYRDEYEDTDTGTYISC